MYRLLGWLALLLVAGFVFTSGFGYRVARDTLRGVFAVSAVPAISDLVHAEVRSELLRLNSASLLIARDAFVRNWLLDGERDPEQMAHYLKEESRKFGAASSFVLSERSRLYYQEAGALKAAPRGNSQNAWFFRVAGMADLKGTSVNPDLTARDAIAVSARQPIIDGRGNLLGASGVGLPLSSFFRLAEKYQTRFACRIYFVDKGGIVIVGDNTMQHLRDLPGLSQVADNVLASAAAPVQTSYRRGEATVLVNARFIPDLDWFLVVERSDQEGILPIEQVFLLNLAVAALVAGLVLSSVFRAFRRYQRSLMGGAGVDPLTGLINRSAYEFVFRQTLLEVVRAGEPLSLIVLEIDTIKLIIAAQGPQAGEQVLQGIAELAKKAVRGSDPVVRWSDCQFAVQLRDCPLDRAMVIAEKLRLSVASHDFELGQRHLLITVSLGVARLDDGEIGSHFIDRTHQVLALARRKGGNRVEPEIAGSVRAA